MKASSIKREKLLTWLKIIANSKDYSIINQLNMVMNIRDIVTWLKKLEMLGMLIAIVNLDNVTTM